MGQVAEDEVVEVQLVSVRGEMLRRNRDFRNNCKNMVIEVSMPERAPKTGISEGERIVQLYCENRMQIWLCTKDADWALEYLRDQIRTKGVKRVAPDDRGPGARPEASGQGEETVVAGIQGQRADDVDEMVFEVPPSRSPSLSPPF